ncbi:MAG: Bro-N domain-containing protein [Deltaproteobacteria bacterium]|nr:Bro-N domain-containing protein [Deltaproteobacteria bacterium]
MNQNKNPNIEKMVVFRQKQIRRLLHNGEWYFSVIDVVEVLSNSETPKRYWSDLKRKLIQESGADQPYDKIVRLKLPAEDDRLRETDCADTETLFRVIQSIPSPRAEPFKRWLAKVGYERVQEIENPELATKRTRTLYKLKGYPDDWIEKRMRGIAIREELTDEWQSRGAQEQKDYEILTAEISKSTFGISPSEYKDLKGLKRENLRDHMDDFELIFTMLGERSTTEIHRNENSSGMTKLKSDAKAGGEIAGMARKKLEKRLGRSVISKENYLPNKKVTKVLKD